MQDYLGTFFKMEMPSVDLTNHVVEIFGMIIVVATVLWILLFIFGFLTREKNLKAQGLDKE